MIDFPHLKDIVVSTPSTIVMLVADGLGGLAHPETRRSELEVAHTPNLDRLAQQSACGLTVPVLPGIAPGSGPGHLALFGYDPVKYLIGRGVLEALGIDVDLREGDIAARGNFCTVDADGNIIDRRAGRIATEAAAPLVDALDRIEVPGVEALVYPVKDYRFVLHLRGDGLSDQVTEMDPGRLGVPPLEVHPTASEGQRTAKAINSFVAQAQTILREHQPANMLLLRGVSRLPNLPAMGAAYGLNPAAIAAHPMYRGLAHTLGMHVVDAGSTFDEEVQALYRHYSEHDFFYIHYKPADAAGEDGDYEAKVRALEELDAFIPSLLELDPDVFLVAGDHATPAIMANHTWHPVPFLLRSQWTLGEGVEAFNERACATGSLGTLPANQAMLLALAHAGKLTKFGP